MCVVTGSKVEGTAIETIQNKVEETGRKISSAPSLMHLVYAGDSANKLSQTGKRNDIAVFFFNLKEITNSYN